MPEDTFKAKSQKAIQDPESFWSELALEKLDWYTPFSKACDATFKPPYKFKWFNDGVLNVCYNCVDRHLPEKKDKTAIIWQGEDINKVKTITYQKLYIEVNRFAVFLKDLGVKRGDVVTLYLPMVPEALYAMLACARLGAIHSVVFGGFSGEALSKRLHDAGSVWLITAKEANRGMKQVSFKPLLEQALNNYSALKKIIFIDPSNEIAKQYSIGVDYFSESVRFIGKSVEPERMGSEDPLFLLYTSGSTGNPKGLLHTCAGYLLYAAMTYETVLQADEHDIHWCTADIGWITGHSYVVYGPLASGATVLIYEGTPNNPYDRIWELIDKHRVSTLYTAPTLIRALMRDQHEIKFKLDSLKILGTVGEPINPEAWRWYKDTVGRGQLPIVDTWWQTETGGILLSPNPNQTKQKPGATDHPLFGITPVILDENCQEVESNVEGALCFKTPWPGIARTIWKNHARYVETYFAKFPGFYYSGDGAKSDQDQSIWITGRMDDVVNVAGHRLSTAEIESALVAHEAVCEAAVVGMNDPTKGQTIAAFVILNSCSSPSKSLRMDLIQCVNKTIGPIAKPHYLQFCSNLPKTRSGKIMRRLIKKIANGEEHDLGDTSTLLNPEIIDEIVNHFNKHDDVANF